MIPDPLRQVEILTFDCYGTLIDWESGLRRELRDLAGLHGVAVSEDALLDEWEAIQFDLISGSYRPYREVLRESLTATFHRRGVELPRAEADRLGQAIGTWQPFDDAAEVLPRLQARYKLGILSNIDDCMLAQSVARLGIRFDQLVTAQQVKSYKPAAAHFREAMARFGRPAKAFLHCAFGFKYDQTPALAAGMQTVWIKRPGWIRDDEHTVPTYEVADLNELAALLEI